MKYNPKNYLSIDFPHFYGRSFRQTFKDHQKWENSLIDRS